MNSLDFVGSLSRELLPAINGDLNVARFDLESEASPCELLRRDQRRARTTERLVDIARVVVSHRPRHALHGFLCRMAVPGVVAPCNGPQSGLATIVGAMASGAGPHSIPTGPMLPVII